MKKQSLGFLGHLVFVGMTGPQKHTKQRPFTSVSVFAWKTREICLDFFHSPTSTKLTAKVSALGTGAGAVFFGGV